MEMALKSIASSKRTPRKPSRKRAIKIQRTPKTAQPNAQNLSTKIVTPTAESAKGGASK